MIYYCKCETCGIDFISHKSQRTTCNKCSTGGSDIKEIICKSCGKPFLLHRNPNDENNFEKKKLCSECSCSKRLKNKIDTEYKGIFTRIENNHYYSLCSKCKCEIEVNPKNKNTTPDGKVRKLCDNCYNDFLNETKEITCSLCKSKFNVKRSKVDGGFLITKYCPDCYNKVYHPEYKIKICKYCGKEFKIYPNSDGKFTLNKLYCSDCSFNNPLIKEKHNNTCLAKYGVNWSCLTTMCQEKKQSTISKINKKFADLLDKYNIRYEMEWLDKNYSRHYDFYLPDLDILIEINPSYTHSILGNAYQGYNITKKEIDYKKWQHLNRTQDIDKRVIHIWDWDNWDKIINLIKPKQKLYARNLKLKLIEDKNEIKEFLNLHHIQNNCKNKTVSLGLYNSNNLLVQVMTFGKPRYNKNYEWELLRLCSHSDYIITGGAEKLFKYFTDNYKPESIISYCDYSKFTGDVYEKLGFNFNKLTYPSKNWSKNNIRITDNLLRQRGFDQLIGSKLNPPEIYGKGTDNEVLMLEHSWLPVYDCGQKVFEWLDNNNIKKVGDK